jgi:hypothetical protein
MVALTWVTFFALLYDWQQEAAVVVHGSPKLILGSALREACRVNTLSLAIA